MLQSLHSLRAEFCDRCQQQHCPPPPSHVAACFATPAVWPQKSAPCDDGSSGWAQMQRDWSLHPSLRSINTTGVSKSAGLEQQPSSGRSRAFRQQGGCCERILEMQPLDTQHVQRARQLSPASSSCHPRRARQPPNHSACAPGCPAPAIQHP